ncbi:MAG: transporter [Saprospiraceae bacterium]
MLIRCHFAISPDDKSQVNIFSIILFLILTPFGLLSQTCCSGGVPVGSNLGFSSANKGILQYSINYDLNTLKDLYTESSRLDDDFRIRKTSSYLFRSNYSINERFSIEGFVSLIKQSRTIIGNQGGQFKESSFGLGDPVFLILYKLIDKSMIWRIGAGPQIPLGATNKRNSRGLLLVEDLQPGSGAWDAVLFSSFEYSLQIRPSMNTHANIIYTSTGTNTSARGGNFSYEFGNDLQIIVGLSDQLFLFTKILFPGIQLRYRTAQVDKINESTNPGTGGNWVFIKLSTSVSLGKDSNLSISYEKSLYTNVVDTQLSPTFVLNFGFNQTIQMKKKNSINTPIIDRYGVIK